MCRTAFIKQPNDPGRFKALHRGADLGFIFWRLNVSVQLENAVEFYGAISHNKLHGWPVKLQAKGDNHLPAVVDGYASEGLYRFSLKIPQITRVLIFTF